MPARPRSPRSRRIAEAALRGAPGSKIRKKTALAVALLAPTALGWGTRATVGAVGRGALAVTDRGVRAVLPEYMLKPSKPRTSKKHPAYNTSRNTWGRAAGRRVGDWTLGVPVLLGATHLARKAKRGTNAARAWWATPTANKLRAAHSTAKRGVNAARTWWTTPTKPKSRTSAANRIRAVHRTAKRGVNAARTWWTTPAKPKTKNT